jgi:hypothetical protein
MAALTPNRLMPIAEETGKEQICYFLGAGFSYDSRYHLPLTTGFLDRNALIYARGALNERLKVRADDHPELGPLLTRLEKRYGDLAYLNLEDVMTDLHVRTAGIGRPWTVHDPAGIDLLARSPGKLAHDEYMRIESHEPASDFSRDYGLLLLYICLRLRVAELEGEFCEKTLRLLRSLRRRDSIITLNYDTIVERHLVRERAGRTLGGERVDVLHHWIGPPGSAFLGKALAIFDRCMPIERGFLAKLHGSVDWRSCSNPDCLNYRYIGPIDREDFPSFDGAEVINRTACAQPLETVIIPPVATKAFTRFPKLGLMWLQAYHALRLANRWVFMGVSFAPTDMHLRSLLRAASEEWFGAQVQGLGQICVVNPDKKVTDRLWESLSPRVQKVLDAPGQGIATFASIDDYLVAVECTDAARAPPPTF